jgi:hypothetical protein
MMNLKQEFDALIKSTIGICKRRQAPRASTRFVRCRHIETDPAARASSTPVVPSTTEGGYRGEEREFKSLDCGRAV